MLEGREREGRGEVSTLGCEELRKLVLLDTVAVAVTYAIIHVESVLGVLGDGEGGDEYESEHRAPVGEGTGLLDHEEAVRLYKGM